MISVKVLNVGDVKARLAKQAQGVRDKAIGPAINKVAEKARAEINRAIPQEFAVKASEVRNAITLRKARAGNPEALIEIFGSTRKRGRSLNLIHFLAAVQAAGQSVNVRGSRASKRSLSGLGGQLGFLIKRAGGLKKLEGAFVGNKGRTIFRRTGSSRLPIEPLQVIGFSQMFSSRRISSRILAKINAELPVEIDRAIARELGKVTP
ncbi:MAG TPA: phage tail protein [Phycisphaerae bacterium]|nr:phage tail protein [Phycisphaerae bacterium]